MGSSIRPRKSAPECLSRELLGRSELGAAHARAQYVACANTSSHQALRCTAHSPVNKLPHGHRRHGWCVHTCGTGTQSARVRAGTTVLNTQSERFSQIIHGQVSGRGDTQAPRCRERVCQPLQRGIRAFHLAPERRLAASLQINTPPPRVNLSNAAGRQALCRPSGDRASAEARRSAGRRSRAAERGGALRRAAQVAPDGLRLSAAAHSRRPEGRQSGVSSWRQPRHRRAAGLGLAVHVQVHRPVLRRLAQAE
eukprot:scaffold5060_cov123-Isochrysis_galbana.AAC.3